MQYARGFVLHDDGELLDGDFRTGGVAVGVIVPAKDAVAAAVLPRAFSGCGELTRAGYRHVGVDALCDQ